MDGGAGRIVLVDNLAALERDVRAGHVRWQRVRCRGRMGLRRAPALELFGRQQRSRKRMRQQLLTRRHQLVVTRGEKLPVQKRQSNVPLWRTYEKDISVYL